MLSDVIGIYFRHQKAPGSDFVKRGDYRLVNGKRRNTVDPMEWTRIEKVGLKVEMSMILRTRNEDKPKCPSCRTLFEGSAIDGWAQCLSCLGHFQVETQVEARAHVQFDNATKSEGKHLTESSVMPPVARESKRGRPWMREHVISGEAETVQFRLFSVINIREVDETPNEPSLPILGHDAIPSVTTMGIATVEDQLHVSESMTAEERGHPIMRLPPRSSSVASVAPIVIRGRLVTPPSRETTPTPAPTSPGARRPPSHSTTESSSSGEEESSEESEGEDDQDEDSDVKIAFSIDDSESLTPVLALPTTLGRVGGRGRARGNAAAREQTLFVDPEGDVDMAAANGSDGGSPPIPGLSLLFFDGVPPPGTNSRKRKHRTEKKKPISSYWTVVDREKIAALIEVHGDNFKAIAAELSQKSTNQVKNYIKGRQDLSEVLDRVLLDKAVTIS